MSDLCTVCGLPIDVGDYPCITTARPHQRGINGAIGDECDIWQENGFRHPRHFTHKSELKRALAEVGKEITVRHVSIPGTDKSPFTTDWSRGMDPYTMAAATALMSRNGQGDGKDPDPEPLAVKWQVRDVDPKSGPGPWRDCEVPR